MRESAVRIARRCSYDRSSFYKELSAFTAQSFAELDAWLAEDGWPPGHMDAAMLEGYLVALLVWPIELSAGAWLPPIWGIRGWKVAAKIATTEAYNRFLRLVGVGFLQDLERQTLTDRLSTPSPVCTRARRPHLIRALLRRLRLGDWIYDRATRKFLWLRFTLCECSLGG